MEPQKPEYKRKLAMVTGASSGIGYELAKQFLMNGFDLIITAENDRIFTVAKDLRVFGDVVEPFKSDLSTYEGVEALYQQVREYGRPLDAIAINAGVGVSGDFARETQLKDELNLIQLNVVSSVHLAKLVLKDMVDRNQGRVLITASLASTSPGPFLAVYQASKAFLQSFAEAIRNELNNTKVTVTSLLPSATDTNFYHRAKMEDTPLAHMEKDDPAMVAKDGFEALMEGRDMVVTGSLKNKVQAVAARILPQKWSAQRSREVTESKDKHHS